MSSWVNSRMEYQEINISFLIPTVAGHSIEHEEIFTWSRGVRRLTSLTGDDSTRCTPNVYTGKLYTFIFFGVDISQATSTLTNSSARKKNQSDMSDSFLTPWTIDCQAPLPTGFSRQEYSNGLPFPSPGDLPDPGIESRSPALQADSLPSEPQGKLILEWVDFPFSRGSSQPRDQIQVSHIAGGFFTS